MAQHFIPYEPNQTLLFPPSLNDWLPQDHLARFISDTVDEMDLSAFLAKYEAREDGRGRIAYHPRMMLKVLFYAYCMGIFSSRKIAAGLLDLVALRFLSAGNEPSHRTIARFRQEYIGEFQDLFVQTVRIAKAAQLVKLGTIAIDGTKVKANASKHKAMSYQRMKSEERRLRDEIVRITKRAQSIDEAEDREFGPDFRGDRLPEELSRREDRLKTIREAKARLEQEQLEEDEASGYDDQDPKQQKRRKKPMREKGVPEDRKQSNFTDPESRILGDPKRGFVQAYNAQVAVDDEEQIIVASEVTQIASDSTQLVPVTKAVVRNTGEHPRHVLADAGYRSEQGFAELEEMGIDAHVALGRGERQPDLPPGRGPATKRMYRRRKTKRSHKLYKKRKSLVEPAIGWIKAGMNFRSFSMRGLAKVRGEWALACGAMNMKRMAPRMVWI